MANMRKSRRLRRNKKSARRVQRRTDRNTMRQQGGNLKQSLWRIDYIKDLKSLTANKLNDQSEVTSITNRINFNDFAKAYVEGTDNATMVLSLNMGDGQGANDSDKIGYIAPINLTKDVVDGNNISNSFGVINP